MICIYTYIDLIERCVKVCQTENPAACRKQIIKCMYLYTFRHSEIHPVRYFWWHVIIICHAVSWNGGLVVCLENPSSYIFFLYACVWWEPIVCWLRRISFWMYKFSFILIWSGSSAYSYIFVQRNPQMMVIIMKMYAYMNWGKIVLNFLKRGKLTPTLYPLTLINATTF